MNNKHIKIGIVGAGWIAEKAHIPALLKIADVKVEAIFDVSETRGNDICRRFGISKWYSDYEEFLASGVDAVIIASPNYTHGDYSIKALSHGIHVLCEKPIALSIREVEEAIKVANQNNCVYLPGFVNRFRKDVQQLKEIIDTNQIGKIMKIDAAWVRKSGMPRPGSWFTSKQYAGGGVLNDLGSHILDIIMMLHDENINLKEIKVDGYYTKECSNMEATWFGRDEKETLPIDVEDTVSGQITSDTGEVINFYVSWCAPVSGDYTCFIVEGSKGKASLHTLFGFSQEGLFKKNTLSIEGLEGNQMKIIFDETQNIQEQAFEDLERYFVEAIKTRRSDVLSSMNALRSIELIEKLYKRISLEGKNLENIQVGSVLFE